MMVEIVAVGANVDACRIGERVLTRTMQNHTQPDGSNCVITQGSETRGAFAQYMSARAVDAVPVNSTWSDVELASIPCAYTTAEGMLVRAGLGAENVLITGASGGVGSAAIQLAKRRGATVWAVTKADKAAALRDIGADHTLDRDAPLPENQFDVVLDLVAGPRWPDLLDALKPTGRYVASGAIAGPMVTLDVRTLYLKDLSLLGSTAQPDHILPDVVGYIERGEALDDYAYRVAAFHEKPDAERAATYVASGRYFWNGGIFLARPSTLLAEMQTYCPDIVSACQRAVETAGETAGIINLNADAFAASPSDSIDYAVMEKTGKAAVVEADIGWSDIGSWAALHEMKAGERGNALSGDVHVIDTQNCLVQTDGMFVAAIGVEDLAIVVHEGAVLVSKLDSVQDVKEVVAMLKDRGRTDLL